MDKNDYNINNVVILLAGLTMPRNQGVFSLLNFIRYLQELAEILMVWCINLVCTVGLTIDETA